MLESSESSLALSAEQGPQSLCYVCLCSVEMPLTHHGGRHCDMSPWVKPSGWFEKHYCFF